MTAMTAIIARSTIATSLLLMVMMVMMMMVMIFYCCYYLLLQVSGGVENQCNMRDWIITNTFAWGAFLSYSYSTTRPKTIFSYITRASKEDRGTKRAECQSQASTKHTFFVAQHDARRFD